MFTKAILPDTLRGIQLAARIPLLRSAYLAGGTALALQLGHRISEDLDFFTQEAFDEQIVARELKRLPEFTQDQLAWRTIMGTLAQTKFSLFYYEYQLIELVVEFEGIRLAGKKDIAAMKIHAIEDRGAKRDFIDLFFLKEEFLLETMLEFYDQKYHCLEDHLYHILKGMDYFVSADIEEGPEMLTPVDWSEVKHFFTQEAKRIAKLELYP